MRTTAPSKPLGDCAWEVAVEFLQFPGVNRKQRSDCRTLPIFSIQASLVLPSSCTHRKAPWQLVHQTPGQHQVNLNDPRASRANILRNYKDARMNYASPLLPVWSWKLCKTLHISSWVQKYTLCTVCIANTHGMSWSSTIVNDDFWVVQTPKEFPCQICCHPTQAAWFPVTGGTWEVSCGKLLVRQGIDCLNTLWDTQFWTAQRVPLRTCLMTAMVLWCETHVTSRISLRSPFSRWCRHRKNPTPGNLCTWNTQSLAGPVDHAWDDCNQLNESNYRTV